MENKEWIQERILKLSAAAKTYEEKAYYTGLLETVDELSDRIEQRQAELDGRSWNANNW